MQDLSFLEKLIDWKDFELFIAGMYNNSEKVEVIHDVTEKGKSGAKRQVDVKVIQTTKLHTIKTLIECKRWKKKVTRRSIDVVATSVEDLNYNKGVIFTTKGYEEGAILYAKHKNIDIFLVRDLTEAEWGKPGRKFSLILQYFTGVFGNIQFSNLRYVGPIDQPLPTQTRLNLNLSKDRDFSQDPHLFSKDPSKSVNLSKTLEQAHSQILKQTSNHFNSILPFEQNEPLHYKTIVTIDITKFPFRSLKFGDGVLIFDSIVFDFYQQISQSKLDIDRGKSLDFALIVENFITNQRNYVSKSLDSETLVLSDPIIETKGDEKTLDPNSIIKITLEPNVGFSLDKLNNLESTPPLTIYLREKLSK